MATTNPTDSELRAIYHNENLMREGVIAERVQLLYERYLRARAIVRPIHNRYYGSDAHISGAEERAISAQLDEVEKILDYR